jgi:hypothetical protein
MEGVSRECSGGPSPSVSVDFSDSGLAQIPVDFAGRIDRIGCLYYYAALLAILVSQFASGRVSLGFPVVKIGG